MAVMRILVVVLVVLTAACNVMFPRDGEVVSDAAPDAEPADGPAPRCPNNAEPTRQVFPAVADTTLSSSVANQNYGGLGVATISTDLGPQGSRGLFRFQPGDVAAATTLELRLILPSAMTSNDCGAGCGSCAGIERAGAMRAFTVDNRWVESEATWARASAALAWQQAGAAGTSDRGPELAPSPDHAILEDTVFAADPATFAELLGWLDQGRLSFVVESTAAKQVVRTRENTCDGGASGARLEILGCQ